MISLPDLTQNQKYNVFLKRRRDKIKAELGMFVSVINPDKMFDT